MRSCVMIGILLLGLVAAAPAGEGSYEALVKDTLKTFEAVNESLGKIRDMNSAAEQQKELEKHAKKLVDLRKQADEWKQPNKEEKDRLAKEYAPKFEVVFKKLKDESIRVKGVPGGDKALEELAVLKDNKDKGKKDGK